LSLWCELPDGVDAAGVTVAAEDEKLLVAAGPRFAVVGGLERWVRLPYVLAPEVMTEAVERFARAVEATRLLGSRRAGTRRPTPSPGTGDTTRRPLVA
jgi:DNA-binding transcriptional MocR family regulator